MRNGNEMSNASFYTRLPSPLKSGDSIDYISEANQAGDWLLQITGVVEKVFSTRGEIEIAVIAPDGAESITRVQVSNIVNKTHVTISMEWKALRDDADYYVAIIARPIIGSTLLKDIAIFETHLVPIINKNSNKCSCEISVLVCKGCQCGGK